ncbi:hypothetical protein H0H92_001577 [Tricholoma furcatifolium]|nr:hypothetical protein H0H92_001577 [Tricholoma furcatifolium]
MTNSTLSPRGPKAARKEFRANAKARGISFAEAAQARNLLPKPKTSIARGEGRRTHGKMAETYWNGHIFVDAGSGPEDDHKFFCPDCAFARCEYQPSYLMGADGQPGELSTTVLPSLMDIAKPAKPRGVAKDFEVVDPVSRVLVWEDEWQSNAGPSTLEDDELWEEWDEVYQEDDASVQEDRLSYAEALKVDSSTGT